MEHTSRHANSILHNIIKDSYRYRSRMLEWKCDQTTTVTQIASHLEMKLWEYFVVSVRSCHKKTVVKPFHLLKVLVIATRKGWDMSIANHQYLLYEELLPPLH